ncbi:MAG: hypothetical protein RMX59_035405 [Nostoc sp. DedSLP05]
MRQVKHWRSYAIADFIAPLTKPSRNTAKTGLDLSVAILTD